MLVTAPSTALDERIFTGVRDLFLLLLTSQEGPSLPLPLSLTHVMCVCVCVCAGVLFLSSSAAVMNQVVRALTQASVSHMTIT